MIGRRWAFNFTCLCSAAFGLALGGCNTYTAFLVVTAFVGFGVGGNIPIDTTICLEFIPQNRRFLLALLSIFQPIGVVVCSGIAYGFIPKYSCTPNFSESNALKPCNQVAAGVACCTKATNMGWRYLLFTLGAITLGVFFLRFVVFRFQESPKYLVYRGHDEKAIKVLEHIAKFNKRPCGISHDAFDNLTNEHNSMNSTSDLLGAGAKQLRSSLTEKVKLEFVRYRMLFDGWQMTRLTILVWLTYICDFWGFTLAGLLQPKLLQETESDCSSRHLPTIRTSLQERSAESLARIHLPQLCLHLPTRHCGRRTGLRYVWRTIRRPQMDNGHLIWADGRLDLYFQRRQR